VSIDGAMGVLVHFDIHPDYPIMEIGESMGIVEESVDGDASVIFGTTTNSDMEIDEVKITIIATGFEDKSSISELPPKTKTQETLLNGTNTINTINTRKVVGGYDGSQEDIIDIPTFMRKQMD
ncbi:MAG: cell division protein FtsZ, partial [Sulfurovum sp.]|nr:cell division protein FtsZ [Sulfurovum sp.]